MLDIDNMPNIILIYNTIYRIFVMTYPHNVKENISYLKEVYYVLLR